VSCCMRDAVTLEARGIPTVIIVNDVFKPIAHGTKALLGLPDDYVDRNIVWLPHPTSNLTKEAAERLIDERIDEIRAKLMGRPHAAKAAAATVPPSSNGDALAAARAAVSGLADSLRSDGAHLELETLDEGVLSGSLRIGELTCEDGSCILPTEQLERMIDALVRPKIAALKAVALREVRS